MAIQKTEGSLWPQTEKGGKPLSKRIKDRVFEEIMDVIPGIWHMFTQGNDEANAPLSKKKKK